MGAAIEYSTAQRIISLRSCVDGTRQSKVLLHEFRARYRFEASSETAAVVQAKCAVLDVLSLVLQFQVNSLLTVCHAASYE